MHRQGPRIILFCAILITFAFGVFLKISNMNSSNKTLDIWGWQYDPYSTDPMEFDDAVHHVAWTSVYGTLVSDYRVGQISAQIASSWQSNTDLTEWTFEIKPNCYFENKDKITAATVAQSLKRISMLQHQKGSESGFTEDLIGISTVQSMTDSFQGISATGDRVILKFNSPKPDLLTKIGFGLYSIVHPSQYDNQGKWLNKKSIIGSGPYRVKSWSKGQLQLTLNEPQTQCFDLPKKPLKEFNLIFGNQLLDTKQQAIISGSSKSLMVDDTFEFLGPADSDILYVRVYKKLPGNLNSALRDLVVSEMSALKNINFSLNRSFLPLTIQNMQGGQIGTLDSDSLNSLRAIQIKVPKYEPSKKSEKYKNILSYTEAFSQTMAILRQKYDLKIVEIPMDYTSFGDVSKRAALYDLEMLLTGVVVTNPYDDVKFMFKSKEGIQLPDLDGSITQLLEKGSTNIAKINDKIWEQSLIIPITHYSSGLWIKKDIFDVSNLNHTLPATNFQFIGYK